MFKVNAAACLTVFLPWAMMGDLSAQDLTTDRPSDELPNILLIVADDLGFTDLGCYGSEIRTPNLDKLAHNGLTFSQFYNAARCCPSRACLLTGLYPHQAGVGHMTYDAGEPGYRGELRADVPTIADVLREAGYATFMSGKWHVTSNVKPESPKNNWPRQRGFDEFFGTLPGHGSLWDPHGLVRNDEPVKADDAFFYTDALADHTIACLRSPTSKPKFLYLAFTAPHYPLHARPETIASYTSVYNAGWDAIRRQRHQTLIEKGFMSQQTPLTARDPASIPWDEEPNQAWQAHRMQVFAAMVTEMDAAIGRIVSALKDDGTFDTTLIVFVSDNGGSNEGHLHNSIERMDIPWRSWLIPEKTLSGQPVRAGDWPNELLGGPETYGSYGPRWANVSNTPFRRHKSWVHEGGISTPCIVHWPRVIRDPRTTDTVAHLVDLMPTFAAAACGEPPHTEGVSLLPLFRGGDLRSRELGWEHEGNRAYRKGPWKIVSEFPGTWATMYPYEKQGRWELYDIEHDRTETRDLSASQPELLNAMIASYETWARRIGVVPWDKLQGKQE